MKEHTIYKTGIKKWDTSITIQSISIVIREYKLKILTPFSCPSDWQIFKHLSISNTRKRAENQDMLEAQMDKAFLDWAIWQWWLIFQMYIHSKNSTFPYLP